MHFPLLWAMLRVISVLKHKMKMERLAWIQFKQGISEKFCVDGVERRFCVVPCTLETSSLGGSRARVDGSGLSLLEFTGLMLTGLSAHAEGGGLSWHLREAFHSRTSRCGFRCGFRVSFHSVLSSVVPPRPSRLQTSGSSGLFLHPQVSQVC